VKGAWIEIQVVVFRVMKPLSDVVGYQISCYRLKIEAARAWTSTVPF
jgi:hypothetical protein